MAFNQAEVDIFSATHRPLGVSMRCSQRGSQIRQQFWKTLLRHPQKFSDISHRQMHLNSCLPYHRTCCSSGYSSDVDGIRSYEKWDKPLTVMLGPGASLLSCPSSESFHHSNSFKRVLILSLHSPKYQSFVHPIYGFRSHTHIYFRIFISKHHNVIEKINITHEILTNYPKHFFRKKQGHLLHVHKVFRRTCEVIVVCNLTNATHAPTNNHSFPGSMHYYEHLVEPTILRMRQLLFS